MYHTKHPGVDCINPAANKAIRANGVDALSGWPSSSQVEGEIAAWFDAKTLDAEKTIVRRLNKAALDHVVYAPIGFFLVHQAWRRNVSGIVKGPLPFFWGGQQDRLITSPVRPGRVTGKAKPTALSHVACDMDNFLIAQHVQYCGKGSDNELLARFGEDHRFLMEDARVFKHRFRRLLNYGSAS